MANTFANSQVIVDTVLTIFTSEITMPLTTSKTVKLDMEFNDKEYRKGDAISYRLQNNFFVGEGTAIQVSDFVERTRTLTIDRQWHVGLEFTGRELTFDTPPSEDYLEQILAPRARSIAHTVESYLAEKVQNEFYHTVGSPTSSISDLTLINQARSEMNKFSIPDNGDRYVGLNQNSSVSLANGTQNFFNSRVNNDSLFKGALGHLATFDMYETVFLGTHISGTGDGSVPAGGLISAGTVQNALASGNVLTVTGLTANDPDAFKRGDIILVSGVNAYNPITVRSVGQLKLVVLADAASNALSQASVSISPIIEGSGVYKNIDLAQIDAGTVLNIYDNHDVSVAYHCDAIVHSMPRLAMLGGNIREQYMGASVRQENKDFRISMLYTEGSDVKSFEQVNRTDLLQGATINGDYGIRIISEPTGIPII